jgi:antitoxin component YwqK of YwqJK toxin-antitoxin module
MKALVTLIIIAIAGLASAAEYSTDNISFQNGIYVDQQGQAITGEVTGAFKTTLANGLHNGKASFYRGKQMAYEASGISSACPLAGFDASKYADCIPDGEVKVYNMYGDMIMHIKVKDRVFNNFSYEDGELISEETVIDGRVDGKATYYYFGRKQVEIVYAMAIPLNIKEFYRSGALKSEVRKEKSISVWGACYDEEGNETVLTKEDLELFDLLGGYLSCGTSNSEDTYEYLSDMYRRAGQEAE